MPYLTVAIKDFSHRSASRYLHRSVLYADQSPGKAAAAFLIAIFACMGIFANSATILQLHEFLRESLMNLVGVPVSGHAQILLFGSQKIMTVLSPIAGYSSDPLRLTLSCGIPAVIMLSVCLRVRLSSSLMVAGMIVLAASLFCLLWVDQPAMNSLSFTGLWVRCEFVIWMIMPLLVAAAIGLIMPSFAHNVFWISVTPVYGFFWSIVRLTFCMGILYYAGPVVALLLWAAVGFLSDLLSLYCLYSLATWQAHSLSGRSDIHE